MIPKIVRWIGVGLFAISFFLPAVRFSGGAPGPGDLPGFVCAWFSFQMFTAAPLGLVKAVLPHGSADHDWLMVLEISGAGIVVPTVVGFLLCFLGTSKRLIQTRRICAVIIVAGLVCAWCYLQIPGSPEASDRPAPLIGHYLWTLGILLILAPEIIPDLA